MRERRGDVGMIAECNQCRIKYEVTGTKALMVLTGGMQCPNCGGNIDVIVTEVKK